jgi:hypothetical protein
VVAVVVFQQIGNSRLEQGDLMAACLVWMGPASSGAQWFEAPVSAGASRFNQETLKPNHSAGSRYAVRPYGVRTVRNAVPPLNRLVGCDPPTASTSARRCRVHQSIRSPRWPL